MLETGVNIGQRYEIIDRIGSGGMADVYKAMDAKLNRLVAVKVLRQEFRIDKTFVSKFQKEAAYQHKRKQYRKYRMIP